MSIVSFKQRVVNDLIALTPRFRDNFIDKEYLIFSSKMANRKYYIISSNEDNFMHLTGIKFRNSVNFYNKCINGTLVEADIDIPSNKEKGNIRRKINALPNLINMFNGQVLVEEGFVHNDVSCALASTDLDITIGFCTPNENGVVKPKTLMKGYAGFTDDAPIAELILERKRGDILFSKILCGNKELIINNGLETLVAPELL